MVKHLLNLILQHQLAALQSSDFQLIGERLCGKGGDFLVEAPMLRLHRIEPFRIRGLVGSLITLVGIVVLANPTGVDRLPWLPLLAMLGASSTAAEAGVVLKLLPSVVVIYMWYGFLLYPMKTQINYFLKGVLITEILLVV